MAIGGGIMQCFAPIGFAISNALAHAAQQLAPPAGERSILDLATAAGWSARNIACTGRT
jgi:hypothetical protein